MLYDIDCSGHSFSFKVRKCTCIPNDENAINFTKNEENSITLWGYYKYPSHDRLKFVNQNDYVANALEFSIRVNANANTFEYLY